MGVGDFDRVKMSANISTVNKKFYHFLRLSMRHNFGLLYYCALRRIVSLLRCLFKAIDSLMCLIVALHDHWHCYSERGIVCVSFYLVGMPSSLVETM